MLHFASTCEEASAPGGPEALARARLRAAYEAALRWQGEGRHAKAARCLAALLSGEAADVVWPRLTRSDEAWLRRLRLLALRHLAASQRALGRPASALRCLRASLCLRARSSSAAKKGMKSASASAKESGGAGVEEGCATEWSAAAESAAAVGDWGEARLCLERSLDRWPEDPRLLRALVRVLLELGDKRACRRALQALAATKVGLSAREAWLQSQMETDLQSCPFVMLMEPAPSDVLMEVESEGVNFLRAPTAADLFMRADFRGVENRRSKRLRTAAAARKLDDDPVDLGLARLTAPALLAAAARLAVKGVVPPSVDVRFKFNTDSAQGCPWASEDITEHAGAAPASAEGPARAVGATWAALESLLARGAARSPWDGERWSLAALEASCPQGIDASKPSALKAEGERVADEEAAEEETSWVVAILMGSEADDDVENEELWEATFNEGLSIQRPWWMWMDTIARECFERHDLIHGRSDSSQSVHGLVELVVGFALSVSTQPQALNTPGDAPSVTLESLTWLGLPTPPQEDTGLAEARTAVRDLFRFRGLDLVELCVAERRRSAWAAHAGLELLKALGFQADEPWQISAIRAMPLLNCSGLPWPLHDGPLPSDAPTMLAARSSPWAIRWLWALGALGPQRIATVALERCLELARLREAEVSQPSLAETFTGEVIDTKICALRLAERLAVQRRPAEAGPCDSSAADLQNFPALARKVISSLRLSPPSQPLPDGDAACVAEFLRLAHEVCVSLSAGSTSQSSMPASKEQALMPLLLEGCVRLVVDTILGLASLEWSLTRVEESREELLAQALAQAKEALEMAARWKPSSTAAAAQPWHARLGEEGPDPKALLCGISFAAAGGAEGIAPEAGALFLAPPSERLALACLVLATRVATGAAVGSSRVWLLTAQAALGVSARAICLGLLPPAVDRTLAKADDKLAVGGLLLAPRKQASASGGTSATFVAAPRVLSPREVWLCASQFLTAAHDLSLLLPQLNRGFPALDTREQLRLGKRAEMLFGRLAAPGQVRERFEFSTSLASTSDAPLAFPHIIMACALRVGSDTISTWRREWRRWLLESIKSGNTVSEARHLARVASLKGIGSHPAWRCSQRALGEEDGEPSHHLFVFCGDAEVDRATCRLAARALSCFGLFSVSVDPDAGREGADNFTAPGLCRLLSEPACTYEFLGEEWQRQASRLFERCSSSVAPPHVLSLALMLRCRLQAPGAADAAVHFEAARHLDAYLLAGRSAPVGVAGGPASALGLCLPVALFHPLVVPRFAVDFFDELGLTAKHHHAQFYGKMCQALKREGSNSASRTSAASAGSDEGGKGITDISQYPAKLFGGMGASVEPMVSIFHRISAASKDMLESEWPPRRADVGNTLSKLKVRMQRKAPAEARCEAEAHDGDTAVAEMQASSEEVERWEEEDRRRALLLCETLAASAPLCPPLGFHDVYRGCVVAAAARRPKEEACLEVLSFAVRDIAVCPKRWETWGKVATAFKHLFFMKDDQVSADDDWKPALRGFMHQRPHGPLWAGRLRQLYLHARLLNLMLSARLEEDLTEQLAAAVNLSPEGCSKERAIRLAECKALAEHWVLRQVDLLVLFKCRCRTLAKARHPEDPSAAISFDVKSEERRMLLNRRCDRIARRLLWFLLHCTDCVVHLVETSKLLRTNEILASWPRPRFAQQWLNLASSHDAAGAGDLRWNLGVDALPPRFAWFVPYMVARSQWKLRKAAMASLDDRTILCLLSDACRLEAASRHKASPSDGLPRRITDAPEEVLEPLWRLCLTRLHLARESPAGAHLAASFRNEVDDDNQSLAASIHGESQASVVAECERGLRKLVEEDQNYISALALQSATEAIKVKDYNAAISRIEKTFTFPKRGPNGPTGVGTRIWKVEARAWNGLGEMPCPWTQLGLRHRKYNHRRAKVYFVILRVHRESLSQVLPPGSASSHDYLLGGGTACGLGEPNYAELVSSAVCELPPGAAAAAAGPWRPGTEHVGPGVDFAGLQAASSSLSGPSGQRPDLEAVRSCVGLMIALVRGVKWEPSNKFRQSFHWGFVHLLRITFQTLFRAGTTQGRILGAKMMFDWPLVAMARSCCLALDGNTGGDLENGVNISALKHVYPALVAQLWVAHAGSARGRRNGLTSMRGDKLNAWAAAEAVFKAVRGQLPSAMAEDATWGSAWDDERRSEALFSKRGTLSHRAHFVGDVIAVDDDDGGM